METLARRTFHNHSCRCPHLLKTGYAAKLRAPRGPAFCRVARTQPGGAQPQEKPQEKFKLYRDKEKEAARKFRRAVRPSTVF
jgi:hypothetical protein